MASSVTTPVATRLFNREVAELRHLAVANDSTVSKIIAEAIRAKLPALRESASR